MARQTSAAPEAHEPAPWSVLNDRAAEHDAYCRAWLALQCGILPGATVALLLWRPQASGATRVTAWPETGEPGDLPRLAERALADRRTVVAWGRREPGTAANPAIVLYVAQLIGPDEAPYGVVAVALMLPGGIASADPDAVARQLRFGAGWLEALLRRDRIAEANALVGRAEVGLDLLAVAGEHHGLAAASIAIVNEAATRLACDRVSLGLVRGGAVRLQAMSHSATFEKRSGIAGAIEEAMEEALSQGAPVALPAVASTKRAIAIAHRDLATAAGGRAAVVSAILIGAGGASIGVLTLERHRDEPFDENAVQLAETLGALLGPMIGLQREADRWVAGRVFDLAEDGLKALFGPRRPALKLLVGAVAALMLVLAFAQGGYRVGAKSVLEGEVQRAAVAPFDGIIRMAPVRAGDTVHEGDILAQLDDKDLVLERLKSLSEREKLVQKHREALAKHDRSTMAVLAAQIDEASSQLALAEEKLARSRIRAPFDGIVVSGDLSQMLGSPVEKGKVLFEVAPLNAYRLIVQVDERDLRWVQSGQSGSLALASMPARRLPFTIAKVTPVATAEDGRNYFRVEASLEPEANLPLRPGMEGVAKIETGTRNLVWIWTHSLIDWLRLAAWKWLP